MTRHVDFADTIDDTHAGQQLSLDQAFFGNTHSMIRIPSEAAKDSKCATSAGL